MIDEKRALDLLTTLGDPAGPMHYDVARAVREGRRRRTRGRLAVGAGSLVATAAAIAGVVALLPSAGAAPAPPAATPAGLEAGPAHTLGPALPGITKCVSEPLPIPDGETDAGVAVGDPTGTFLAGRAGDRIVLWENGKDTTVDAPGNDPVVTAVNSRGVMVGNGQWDGGGPWAAAGGTVVTLPGPADATAAGIDEAGVVVGHRPQAELTMPVIWDSTAAQPRDLPLPEGFAGGRALALLPDGRIIGTAGTAKMFRMQQAVIWTADHSRAEVLKNPEGKVVGILAVADGWLLTNSDGPARYELATGTWTDLTGDIRLQPTAINALGWIVGMDERKGKAFVHDGRRTLTLAEIPGNPPLISTISDDGRILGANPHGQALRWICS